MANESSRLLCAGVTTDYIDGSKENTTEALQKLGGADLIVVTAPNPDVVKHLGWAMAPRGKILMLARKCSADVAVRG